MYTLCISAFLKLGAMETEDKIAQLHFEIHKQIVNRTLPPGAKLSASTLCKKWGVSRTPLREVLRLLEAEGLVSSERNKGFTVNPVTFEDLIELYPIKIYLEGLAGKLSTPHISADPEKLRALDQLCTEMEAICKKGDVDAFIIKNKEFHSFIAISCENKWLIKILQYLNSQVHRFVVKALHLPQRMDSSAREHRGIYEKLKNGNEKAVEKALQANHQSAFERLRREFE